MKKLFVVISIFLFVGCVGLQTTETQEYTIKKLARIAGITLALECPDDVQEALSYLTYLETIEDGKLKDVAINVAIKYAYEKYGKTSKTVILVAELVDLLKIVIPDETGTHFDTKLLDIAVSSFKEGINLTITN
ncbi:MAG: hypothetical protein U9O65_02100 [Thermotogota bacterium]|nr:hypothetical protein [Thermotogota bacterium]